MNQSFEELKRRMDERERLAQSGITRLIDLHDELQKEWRAHNGCPTDEEFAAYSDGTLPFARRLTVGRHVRRCALCRDEWAALRNLLTDPVFATPLPPPGVPSAVARWRIPRVGLAFGLTIAVLLLAHLMSSWWARETAIAQFNRERHDALAKLFGPAVAGKVTDLPKEQVDMKLAELARDVDSQTHLATPSVNLFDNVKVYSPEKTFLDESFDSTPPGEFPLGLQTIWGGRLMQVIDLPSSPSGRHCLLNEAYPTWNAHAGIDLKPEDTPSGMLTFEVACYVVDMAKGVSFGLKYVRGAISHDNNGVIILAGSSPVSGKLTVSTIVGGGSDLATVVARRWYHVKATVDLNAHTIDVFLDGHQIGKQLRLAEDLSTKDIGSTHYDFNCFSFGGIYFAE